MSLDLTGDSSTLVQVMAWWSQATSHYHYLNQCWPRSMSPCGVTRPQWVKWWHKGESGNEGPWLNWDWKWTLIIEMIKRIWAAVTEFSQETENFHPWWHGSGTGLAAYRQQAITWTNDNQDLQRHMASLSLNELNHIIHWIGDIAKHTQAT